MNKIIFYIVTAFFIINSNACQYPVDISELPDAEKFLIINAEITETYAKVNVTYTLDAVTPDGGYLFPTPPNASAYIMDSKGNRTDFTTNGSINHSLKGIVGETYKLYVQVNGETYESQAETMPRCPELDSLTVIYTRESSRDAGDLYYDGFDVYAQLTDFAGQENYYQWDWIHYERAISCGITKEREREFLLPCDPNDCWNITYNTRTVVQADQLRDGKPIAQKVVRVPFSQPPNKYYLRVEQRALSPTVFTYLQSLQTQTQNVGSLFDIPAQTHFSPNIYNVNNASEKVLGIFNVFSSRYKIIYIDMQQEIAGATVKVIPNYLPFKPYPYIPAPCVESRYRTQIKPEAWVD